MSNGVLIELAYYIHQYGTYYDMIYEYFKREDTLAKSTAELFFFPYIIRYRLNLSKEVLYIIANQYAAQLKALKVCHSCDLKPGCAQRPINP